MGNPDVPAKPSRRHITVQRAYSIMSFSRVLFVPILTAILLIVFPQIALFLPGLM